MLVGGFLLTRIEQRVEITEEAYAALDSCAEHKALLNGQNSFTEKEFAHFTMLGERCSEAYLQYIRSENPEGVTFEYGIRW